MQLSTLLDIKMCARWVPRYLTGKSQIAQKKVCLDLLHRFEAEGEDFLSRIVTGDETWDLSKKQNDDGIVPFPLPAEEKKFKTTASAGKILITEFWDCEGEILIDVMPRSGTSNPKA